MPSRDLEHVHSESSSLLHRGQERAQRFFHGFVDFAFQGNILEIAFGLIVAAAFTDLIKSFVSGILMPPISIILPLNKNIEEKFAVLRAGDRSNSTTTQYSTVQQALDDGAVVMAYGSFIYQLVSFTMVGLCLYGVAHIYTLVSHDPIIKFTIKCRYCRKRINEKVCNVVVPMHKSVANDQALRCVNCSSWQDGREDTSS
ncbi:Large-conductance mechanosensitive channel [Akanthomyces lecanii RCEF 1005]|uniref:Large-conductance mechanosensitive channel n=1 Tax=Akanthomyces lecanii RCEF 1005 TaxID=1081108 RepID=A0A168K9L3_CORDF|nr:Large-conductance mechanosensitive channel [Akanthomyces lecanii RCEF 1005]